MTWPDTPLLGRDCCLWEVLVGEVTRQCLMYYSEYFCDYRSAAGMPVFLYTKFRLTSLQARFEPPPRQLHVTATAPRPRNRQNPRRIPHRPPQLRFLRSDSFSSCLHRIASLSSACCIIYLPSDISFVWASDENRRRLFLQLATCGGRVADSAIDYPFGLSPFLSAFLYQWS